MTDKNAPFRRKIPQKDPIAQVPTINTTSMCALSKLGAWALAQCAQDVGEQEQIGASET